MTGLLVSVNGFSKGAIDRAESTRDRPIILLTGSELETLLDFPRSVRPLLDRKMHDLVVNASVNFDDHRGSSRPLRSLRESLPASEVVVLASDGSPWTPLHGGGRFNNLVFVDELPDVDWVPASGHGVVIDLPVEPVDELGFITVLHQLTKHGWTTDRARWSIQQADTNWHGAGCREFADAVAHWDRRYDALTEIHHTEHVVYADVVDDGLYTLSADLAAHPTRRVDHCSLSFQLPGVPIDVSPLRNLAKALEVDSDVYFRPMAERAVERRRVSRGDAPDLTPLGLLVQEDEDEEGSPREPIVTGVVVANPFHDREDQPGWWPIEAVDSEILVCGLRSWHPLQEAMSAYYLFMVEWTWTSDAFLFRPVVDWDWKDTAAGVPPWEVNRRSSRLVRA